MTMSLRKVLLSVAVTLQLVTAAPSLAAMKLELRPEPNPPEAGDNRIVITISDAEGKPIDGAKIELFPFMPAMAIMPRMEEKSDIKPKGAGRYEAAFRLPMGGTWEMALTVEAGGSKNTSHYSITTGIPGVTSKSSSPPRDGAGGSEPTTIMELGPERLQKIGVRFTEAKVAPMRRDVEAVGVIEQDQTHREEVTLRFSGYVVKQFRGRVGDYVKAGEPLFSVYSPDLVAAQSELLLAEKISADGHSLHQAAGEKLKNLGVSPSDIAQIRRDGKPKRDVVIRSGVSGTIQDISVREGAAVSAGQVTYIIGDLSKSFIVARVFQQEVGDLKRGQAAEVKIPGSGKALPGTVDLIYPQVEPGAGTANVRVVVPTFVPGLRPGVYVDVRFPVELGNLLTIPSEGILYSGRHRYVFVDRGNGGLEPREVEVGRTSGGMTEIREGLKPGERVAASGTFLLGSEAQLRSALPKWKADRDLSGGATEPPAPGPMNPSMTRKAAEHQSTGVTK